MPDSLIQMKGIAKTFPGVVALNNVSLDLNQGEILSIVGENGAGKSTLMKILCGEYPWGTYEGEIHMNGCPLQLHSPRLAERAGIAMIH